MEENNYNQENEFISETGEENEELGLVDKIIGVFASPSRTFDSISRFDPRFTDWLLPVLLLIIVQIGSSFLLMNNPKIRDEAVSMQLKIAEESLSDAVESGKISKQQAAEQMSMMQENIDKQMQNTKVFQYLGILIFGFIGFFFFVTVYFIISKYLLRGTGGYRQAMTAYGMTQYIAVLQYVITIILSLASESMMSPNLASLTGADLMRFNGFLMAKADPLKIWGYVVLGIALANMFQARNTMKYVITVLVLWLLSSFGLYYLGQAIPAMRWMSLG